MLKRFLAAWVAIMAIVGTIGILATPAQASISDPIQGKGAYATVKQVDGRTTYTVTATEELGVVFIPGEFATPFDAYGCSGNVCIRLDSEPNNSNYVATWETTATTSYARCSKPYYLINDNVVKEGGTECGEGAGVFFAVWKARRYFPSPSWACNEWSGFPSPANKPCETISN
ncbi:hypothetical protein C1I98_19755 [Spongiactinospora gelatinilytica]|uniref:Uncharacterized protein n=1 Tax=Spongiactinospora gelatinilytica TaxID=2666298 RepID=A0A2W2G357_9ACTN|nr:hypothetical protein [Spongiactinospora gelatinilytica]PZG42463.1 hypothetical protein C1I98_19755 [Spongiactinospora gelatinilytica]